MCKFKSILFDKVLIPYDALAHPVTNTHSANKPFLSARKRQILTNSCQRTAFANMLWSYEDLPLHIWACFALFRYAVVFWRMYGTEDKQIFSFCLNPICWSWAWTLESIAADTCRTAGYHQALIFVITFVFLSAFLCICISISLYL